MFNQALRLKSFMMMRSNNKVTYTDQSYTLTLIFYVCVGSHRAHAEICKYQWALLRQLPNPRKPLECLLWKRCKATVFYVGTFDPFNQSFINFIKVYTAFVLFWLWNVTLQSKIFAADLWLELEVQLMEQIGSRFMKNF